jgi:hypothetical protein
LRRPRKSQTWATAFKSAGRPPVVFSWGNPSFSLSAAPTATGVYTNVPGAASPYTNTVSGSQTFFRLQAQ